MKKQTFTINNMRRIVLTNMVIAGLFLSANASVSPVRHYDLSNNKVEVKYKGVDKNQMLAFQVKYTNLSGNSFNIIIKDANQEILFQGNYNDVDFNKTFKLPKEEMNSLVFVIEDNKKNIIEKFNISYETNLVENVIINKN
jgi:hypothetical protein